MTKHEEVSDKMAREIVKISEEHMKKYGFRKMTMEQLDKLMGIKE